MSDAGRQLRGRIVAALEGGGPREQLLQEMAALAHDPGFGDCADVWAPALYDMDAHFFSPFLLDHLGRDQEDVIRALLPRIATKEDDALFQRLYRRTIDEARWNQDLGALANASLSDAELRRALERHKMPRERGFELSEEVALRLYERSPSDFAPFILAELRGGWGENRSHYAELREAAHRHGDAEFFWALFRRVATPAEWAESVRELLRQHPAGNAINDELDRRHPEFIRELDGGVLAEVLEHYGMSAVPYIEHHVPLVTRKGAARLLQGSEKLGDDGLYWRIFFMAGKRDVWEKSLLAITKEALPDHAFRQALQRRTPPPSQAGGWSVSPSTALALYRRDPGVARPFLARLLGEVDTTLFSAAEQAGDDELLGILFAQLMVQLAPRVYAVFLTETEATYRKPNADARAELERWQGIVSARFDQIAAQSSAAYATHVARILSLATIDDDWPFKRNVEHNPVFSYLYHQHRDALRSSSTVIRDLLESPHRPIQLVALTALAEEGTDATSRVLENLRLLTAFLLNEAARNTKKLALVVLECAARADATAATLILPVLEEAQNYHALASIDERILVSAVRLRHELIAQEETATLARGSSGSAGTR